jgi:hypothetical protein
LSKDPSQPFRSRQSMLIAIELSLYSSTIKAMKKRKDNKTIVK